MADEGLVTLTASEAAAEIARGAVSAEDYARACLDRIDGGRRRNPGLRRISIASTRSRRRARSTNGAATVMPLGPLHGIPVAIKDIIDTADYPTESARRSAPAAGPGTTPPWSRSCARPARSSSARPSPPNSPIFIPGRPAIRTTRAHARRLVVGLGGCGRGPHGAARARHADQRVGDPAGRVLRRVRRQAEPRVDVARRRPAAVAQARPCRGVRALAA